MSVSVPFAVVRGTVFGRFRRRRWPLCRADRFCAVPVEFRELIPGGIPGDFR
ncbi:hypothetical protein [Streptomyces sp. SID8352]|uniref:hypothetical protein n=1 Tax=Streptomyces sp. SID8352 TaxID=2690338 RepID=UPI00136C0671|nr:hypothetical protein [Streptomyces sp. SID8352]MYU20951.1 hypothetical protein [Streptomyces sp. SID8352]